MCIYIYIHTHIYIYNYHTSHQMFFLSIFGTVFLYQDLGELSTDSTIVSQDLPPSCEALFAHCGSPAATNSTCAQEVLKVHSCQVAASAGPHATKSSEKYGKGM